MLQIDRLNAWYGPSHILQDVSLEVKNTGSRAGEEVIQMYVMHLQSSVARPLKELKGFSRIMLQPGQKKTLTLPLAGKQLAYWDTHKQRFIVEDDRIQIMVGPSSADTKLSRSVRVVH